MFEMDLVSYNEDNIDIWMSEFFHSLMVYFTVGIILFWLTLYLFTSLP